MTEVVLCGMLFCERAALEATGMWSLSGVFSTREASMFPVSLPQWWIFLALTNLEAASSIDWAVRDEEGTSLVLVSTPIPASTRERVYEVALPVTHLVFPNPGRYTVVASMDGYPIAARVLLIVAR